MELCESSDRTGNSDPTDPTTLLNDDSEEEVARMMNQAKLGHELRRDTVKRCMVQSRTTDGSDGGFRMECMQPPMTTSRDCYKNWPLQKHEERWVSRLTGVRILPSVGDTGLGTLECHVNGFIYSTSRFRQVIMHDNVDWYFYQLGNGRKPPLMQFHLRHPIKIRNTETKDIQFCLAPTPLAKVTSVKDSHKIRKTRFTSRFSKFSSRFCRSNTRKPRFCSSSSRNKDLKNFVHKVQETQFACESELPFTGIEFQALDEFQFDAAFPTGAPTICALTSYNLVVMLKEPPYLVVPLWDIQIVNLARIGLEEIEMTVVFKNLERDVLQLRSIPLKFLTGIKHGLNRDDVKYYVNNIRPNWKDLVSEVRERPEVFIAKGGWDVFEDSLTLACYTPVHSYPDLDSDTDSYSDLDSDTDSYSDLDSDTDSYSDLDSDTDSYSDLDSDTDSYSDLDSD